MLGAQHQSWSVLPWQASTPIKQLPTVIRNAEDHGQGAEAGLRWLEGEPSLLSFGEISWREWFIGQQLKVEKGATSMSYMGIIPQKEKTAYAKTPGWGDRVGN